MQSSGSPVLRVLPGLRGVRMGRRAGCLGALPPSAAPSLKRWMKLEEVFHFSKDFPAISGNVLCFNCGINV